MRMLNRGEVVVCNDWPGKKYDMKIDTRDLTNDRNFEEVKKLQVPGTYGSNLSYEEREGPRCCCLIPTRELQS